MLIFNLHHVEDPLFRPERKHISISPQGLRNLIRTVRMLGMEIISLRDVLDDPSLLTSKKRYVAITLDDGYVNNYTQALPVFESERCPATVFVLPGRLGGTNEWDQGALPEAERDPLLSLEQMRALANSPWITLGSHGMTHRDFAKLPPEVLRYEIEESYHFLSTHFADDFLPILAYPWGHYSHQVVEAMRTSSYKLAFTVETAPWEASAHPFEIPRYTAFYRDGNPLILLAKLCRHGLLLK